MRIKTWITFTIVMLLFAGLCGRLWVISSTNPAAVASSQSTRTVVVASTRGTIYDRNLQPLVNDTREYRAAVSPREALLPLIYEATTEERFSELRNKLVKGNPTDVRLTKEINAADGLQLFHVPVRYSQRLLAPHVIGYLDSSGQHGTCGIEYGYDQLLSSYNGKAAASFTTDGRGRYLVGIQPKITDTTQRSSGGIVLTLDKDIQTIVENIGMSSIRKGAIIVMEPHTGDVLAMASFPTFQPSTVSESIQKNDGALLNRAVSLYDCGSVFKMITTAAALENHIPETTQFICNGYMDIDGTRFHCHNRNGHGLLNMSEGFSQSCNVYYIQLAQSIGARALYNTALKFGMQQALVPAASIKTGESLLPAIRTLQASDAALANLSFGQGYLLSTPLHIAQITATIINDGILVNPSLISGEIDDKKHFQSSQRARGERVISSSTSASLYSMMQSAVKNGTGSGAYLEDIIVGGKTGTAETGQVNAEGNRVTQSWFTGYLSYQNKKYVITVLCEDANNTNAKSTTIFRDIAHSITQL